MPTHTLENDHLRIAFDEQGRLACLVNRQTGCDYITDAGRDLWALFYRGPDDPETPIRQSDCGGPQFMHEDGRLAIVYASLRDAGEHPIEASVRITVELAGEELTFRAKIHNRSPFELCEFWFPMICGLGDLGPTAPAAFLLYPESAGRRIVDPRRNLCDRDAQPVRGARPNFRRDLYPGRAAMQWMGLYGTDGSLYIGSHDTTLQTTATNAMLNVGPRPADDSLSLGWIKYPFVQPGRTWPSEPFVVAVHTGDWPRDARRYRTFADTYQDHRRDKPEWVHDMPALHDIIMLHQHGQVNVPYHEIERVATAARDAGIDTVKLTGWADGGHDSKYPDFLPSDRLGGRAELVDNIRRARDQGCRVVLYFHFVQMSPNSEFYRIHGEFCAMKGPGGNPFIDVFTWPSHGSILYLNERTQLINACVATDVWQEQVLACVQRGLDLGVDAIFLDQTAGAPGSYLCFDHRHNHPSPALACGPGKTQLSARARKLVRAHNPNVALAAEYIADVILQYYDFTIPFGMGFTYGGQHFGDMYRLTFPEDVLTCQYISHEDYDQLHYAFVMGYRFFLAPRQQCDLVTSLDPAFVARLSDLIALRRKHGRTLSRGRFLGDQPLELYPGLVAKAYTTPENQAAVAAWNPTTTDLPLEIAWPGRQLTTVETPGNNGPQPTAEYPTLPPNEVAVLTDWRRDRILTTARPFVRLVPEPTVPAVAKPTGAGGPAL